MKRVRCERCSGTGLAPLRPAAQETYDALTNEWQDLAEIAKRIARNGLRSTALANRLVDLLSIGLVVRRTDPSSLKRLQYRKAIS